MVEEKEGYYCFRTPLGVEVLSISCPLCGRRIKPPDKG